MRTADDGGGAAVETELGEYRAGTQRRALIDDFLRAAENTLGNPEAANPSSAVADIGASMLSCGRLRDTRSRGV